MGRTVYLSLLTLLVCFVINVSATTYYIAANGVDSNNGTSKTTPWLHAPGMTGCTGTCASTTPKAGDQFILRGGDTWHAFGTPGGLQTWTFTWSGSSDTNRIYIGVDQTWYSGSIWSRPILDGDNAITTAFVSSCAHDQWHSTLVNISGSYVDFDNFEMRGMCTVTPSPTTTYLVRSGTHIRAMNNYIHGATIAQVTGTDSIFFMGGTSAATRTYNETYYNVFDNSDGSGAPGQPSGWPIYSDYYDFHHNVVRYVSNGLNGSNNLVFNHDNLYEYIIQSWDSASHSGIIEGGLGSIAGQVQYIYNNVTRNTNAGITFSPTPAAGTGVYTFNNVFFGIGNSTNCYQVLQNGSGNSTDYFFNNTFDYPCPMRFGLSSQQFQGTANYQNNHYIGFSTFSQTHDSSSYAAIVDNGNEVYQTESAANNQGYTPSNNYGPTSSGDVTVNAGANLTSLCNAIPDAIPQAACNLGSTGAVAYDATKHAVILPATPAARPATGPWDVGAYEYSSGSGMNVAPPTGVMATVH